jgi:hypothetical protein
MILALVASIYILAVPTQTAAWRTASALPSMINAPSGGYVFVGGQNGTWFEQGQSPRVYQIYLQNFSSVQLNPVRSGGTVWGEASTDHNC